MQARGGSKIPSCLDHLNNGQVIMKPHHWGKTQKHIFSWYSGFCWTPSLDHFTLQDPMSQGPGQSRNPMLGEQTSRISWSPFLVCERSVFHRYLMRNHCCTGPHLQTEVWTGVPNSQGPITSLPGASSLPDNWVSCADGAVCSQPM